MRKEHTIEIEHEGMKAGLLLRLNENDSERTAHITAMLIEPDADMTEATFVCHINARPEFGRDGEWAITWADRTIPANSILNPMEAPSSPQSHHRNLDDALGVIKEHILEGLRIRLVKDAEAAAKRRDQEARQGRMRGEALGLFEKMEREDEEG